MDKSFLVTRPNHDATTNYLFYWCQPLLALAKKKQFSIHDLAGKKATRKELESHVRARKPAFLFLNGHGNATTIAGQNNEPILKQGVNEKVTESTVVYARSCKAGQALGPSLIKNKTKAFIGYENNFVFLRLQKFLTHPLNDWLAALFLEPSNHTVKVLLKGHTAQEAFDRSQNMLVETLKKTLVSSASREEKDATLYLHSNLKTKVILGSPSATI